MRDNKKLTFRGSVEKPLDKYFEAAEKEDKFLTFAASTADKSYKEKDNKFAAKCAEEREKRLDDVRPILSKEPGTATFEDQKKMNNFFIGDSVIYQKSLQIRHENFQEGIKEGKLNLVPGLEPKYLDKGKKHREESNDTFNDFCLVMFKYDSHVDSILWAASNTENNNNKNDNSIDNLTTDSISSIYELAGDE